MRILWYITVSVLLVVTSASGAQEQSAAEMQLEEITTEQALERSRGQVLLHFGEGFSEIVMQAITQNLNRNGYRHVIFRGGIENHMDLYINGRRGKKPFTPQEATGFLLSVLERNASEFRLPGD